MDPWIPVPIIALTYIGIALGTWPALRVNRTTLTGNPQNIIIGIASHISQVDFLASLVVPN